MRTITNILLIAVLGLAAPAHAKPVEAYFKAPAGWKLMPGPDTGVAAYQTAEKKEDSLLVVIRPIQAGGQSAQQWARDEIASVEKMGFRLVEAPAEATLGPNRFVRMVTWNDLAEFGMRNEQYFIAADDRLIEVAILGPEGFFEAQRPHIQEFLASFR